MTRIHGSHHAHRAQRGDSAAPTANTDGCAGGRAHVGDAGPTADALPVARHAPPTPADQRAARQRATSAERAARARALAFAAAAVATPAAATTTTTTMTTTQHHVGGSNVPHAHDRVTKTQHFDVAVNRNPGPEEYTAKMSATARRRLDADGVAYPKLEDEAHVNGKTRTTYAAVDKKAGVLVVGLDNAAYHSKGYKGLSRGERDFAEDMAGYAKEHGLTVVFAAHVPPTVRHKEGTNLPSDAARERTIHWMNRMHERFPDALWVHGHTHPQEDRHLDLNGARGGREVSNVVMAGQVRNSFTKIGTYENGRVLEEYKVRGHGENRHAELVKRTVLARDGKVVDDNADLGAPKGVLYGVSDVHKKVGFKDYYAAIRDDALAAQAQGLAIGYLDVGDHTVKHGRMPVELPRANRTYLVPGNHDYYNHKSLSGVVDSLRPKSQDELHTFVDYTK